MALLFLVFIILGTIICSVATNDYFGAGGFIIGLLFIIVPVYILTNSPANAEEFVSGEYNLYAMQDNMQETNRVGFLYFTMDEDLNYWIRRDTEKGQKVFELENDEVYFEETDGQPKVEIYSSRATTNQWIWGDSGRVEYYKLYVPKGSLTNRFNGDME